MAAAAVGYGQMAIRYALKAGEIMNRAKELLPHGEFEAWLETKVPDVSLPTCQRWARMAKASRLMDLLDNPDIKTITDAYRATGILPEPEPKDASGKEPQEKAPYVLSFRCQYRQVSEWNKDAARDFLYEFERLARLAMQLKTEFGL